MGRGPRRLEGYSAFGLPEGALMIGSGTAAPDTVTLVVSRLPPSQPGLFFQGELTVNGRAGVLFGDGLRCAGTNVVRLEATAADADGFATSAAPSPQPAAPRPATRASTSTGTATRCSPLAASSST